MIHFVGAGPGACDLITVRGAELLKAADVVIYAGSLVNPVLLGMCREEASIYNSAEMTLEEVAQVMTAAEAQGKMTVRLHTGDPCLYGAIKEQMALMDKAGIAYDVTPGVSSFTGAAAAIPAEYTLPGVSQSVIITRMAGRTPVPERESIASLAEHGCTMVIFLSAGMLPELQAELLKGAYSEETPSAIVYKATWPEEKVIFTPLKRLAEAGREHGISRTALVLVGDFLGEGYERSRLYDPHFSTGYRKGNCKCGEEPS
ncbi:MAG: precorrin-4 C(11)-methyltransferase [Lachnospiraceae bacterium]|nr:precorrin-4 C(11)-methyltransferase [Lachnospiraceae bacterium]